MTGSSVRQRVSEFAQRVIVGFPPSAIVASLYRLSSPMKRLLFAFFLALGTVACQSETASAGHPHSFGFGFQPFGFYQPYGAQFGTSIRTPPYFATNPPVYYGARHARPYGVSPFAAPPRVHRPATYTARLRSQFSRLPSTSAAPCCNPYIHQGPGASRTASQRGPVRRNPYVDNADARATSPDTSSDSLAQKNAS